MMWIYNKTSICDFCSDVIFEIKNIAIFFGGVGKHWVLNSGPSHLSGWCYYHMIYSVSL
jgi:hypothetical protein